MIRDLKLLVEGLQKSKSDKDGQEYSMRAEGMLATAIAVFRRLSQLMSSPSIYLPWLIPYGKILHSHLSSFNPSSLPLDPLDTSTTPAAHLKRSTATSAFLRAVSLRLSYISSITVEGGVPVFEEGFKPKVCDFQEFVQSGYVLSGVDNGACFEMLWLAECLFDRVEKKEFDENLYGEVFSFLTHLCDSISGLDEKSPFFETKTELLVKKLKKLENFVSSLHFDSTHHLYPALVRFLFKHGAKLASDDLHSRSVDVLKVLLTVTNKLVPASSAEASLLNPKTRPTTFEIMAVNCEALYILSHIYTSSEKRYDDAIKCLDHIEANIKIQKHCIAECMAGKEIDEEQVATSTLALNMEEAKVKFSRAMIAHCMCDDKAAAVFISELIQMDSVRKSDEVFDLTLYACRAQAITAIAVSDTTHADPFTLLLSKLSPEKDAAKINDTKVDRAHSIISGVDEMLRNKCSNATWLDPQLSDAKEKDDGKSSSKDLCVSLINDAFSILFELEPLCKDDNALKEKLKSVISKGVAVLSMHKLHEYCVKWCQMALNLYTKDEEKKSKEYAGVLSAFAASTSLAGTESSNLLLAVQKSSEAFDIWPLSARFFATWLECALRAEFGGLVELSNIIEELDAKIAICAKKGMKPREMMAAFSMFSYICADLSTDGNNTPKSSEHAVLLLAVLARWIGTLGKATSHFADCTSIRSPANSPKRRKMAPVKATNDCPQSLFELVRIFLAQLEMLVETQEEGNNGAATLKSLASEVDCVLGTCLNLLLEVRGRTKVPKKTEKPPVVDDELEPTAALSRTNSETNSEATEVIDSELTTDGDNFDDDNGVLVWDDTATEAKIGKQEECIWIAEEAWNLGIKAMALEEHDMASEFFAKGHDLILFAYEEEGIGLTINCLDVEDRDDTWWQGEKLAAVVGSARSSDFSVQIMILSVTSTIDALDEVATTENPNMPQDVEGIVEAGRRRDKAVRAFWRIAMAKAEMSSCTETFMQSNGVFVEFLRLRCAIEIGDDQLVVSTVFGDQGIVKKLSSFVRNSHANELMILHCARRAQAKGMRVSATQLFELASSMMLEGNSKHLQQFGVVQRKLLGLSGGVKDAIAVFKRIEETCVSASKAKWDSEGGSNSVESLFHQEDLNWFCVEAYNRGVSLTHYGDNKGSESLLRTALNILPFTDSEVKSYSETIREGYVQAAAALESEQAGMRGENAVKDFVNGFTGSRMHSLFIGVSPQK